MVKTLPIALHPVLFEARPANSAGVAHPPSQDVPVQPAEETVSYIAQLMEHAGDGVFVYGLDGRLLDVNREACNALVYTREELLGMAIGEIEITGYATAMLAGARNRAPGGVESICGWHRRRDGTTFPVEARVSLLEHHGRKIVLSLARNNTEHLQTETRLRHGRQEAEIANAAKGEFLSRLSHELRTPLNAILGFSNLLKAQTECEPQRDCAGYILEAGQRLLQLVDRALEIARVESGILGLSIEPVVLSEVLAASVQVVRASAAERQVAIELPPLEAESGLVAADRQCLQQIFQHLLSNAVKFSPPGGTVTVNHHTTGAGQVRICFRDQGPGIARDDLPRLFQPFERFAGDQTPRQGCGIGLALSKQLITALGGAIGVETETGQGSMFWVEIPAVPMAGTSGLNGPTDGGAADSRLTVLYIDDQEANLILMQYVVAAGRKIRLLTAPRGIPGLEIARVERPDLILLDLNLPDLTGEEVLARLRADAVTRAIPVVALTGDVQAERRTRLTTAGIQGYITKPIDIQEVLSLMDTVRRLPPLLPAAA